MSAIKRLFHARSAASATGRNAPLTSAARSSTRIMSEQEQIILAALIGAVLAELVKPRPTRLPPSEPGK